MARKRGAGGRFVKATRSHGRRSGGSRGPGVAIVKVSSPRPVKHKGGGRRRGGHGSGGLQKRMMGGAIGGFVLGYVDKHFPQLPTIPILGKAGTIAVVAYFVGKNMRMPIAHDVALAAATVTGYEFGATGHVSGDVLGAIATQT